MKELPPDFHPFLDQHLLEAAIDDLYAVHDRAVFFILNQYIDQLRAPKKPEYTTHDKDLV